MPKISQILNKEISTDAQERMYDLSEQAAFRFGFAAEIGDIRQNSLSVFHVIVYRLGTFAIIHLFHSWWILQLF
jgi:hypothetical protein